MNAATYEYERDSRYPTGYVIFKCIPSILGTKYGPTRELIGYARTEAEVQSFVPGAKRIPST